MQDDDTLYRNILRHMHSGVVTVDPQGRIIHFNPAAARILGLDAEQMVGRAFAECFLDDPRNDAFAQAFIDAIYHADETHSREITYFRDGGARYLGLTTSFIWGRNDDGTPRKLGVIAVFADITRRKLAEDRLRLANAELEERVRERTRNLEEANRRLEQEVEQRRRMADELRHLSQHDALTGLANRSLFEESLELALARHRGGAAAGPVVVYFDLDGFKKVNDTLGHGVGDWLLKQVARRVEGCMRAGDLLARMGGDEFTALLGDGPDDAGVTGILAGMQAAIARPFLTETGVEAKVGLSIGVARCPQDGEDAETLIRRADQAMYAAKQSGKGCWRFYAALGKGGE